MSKALKFSLYEIVGNQCCMVSNDGQKVNDRITVALKRERHILISFRNITIVTPTFLNVAFGQLYGQFSEEQIRELLAVEDIQLEDQQLLKRVVDAAKVYFKQHPSVSIITNN